MDTKITNEKKLEMVRKFLRMNQTQDGRYSYGRSSFISDAQIIWEGTNYFVVRSGVHTRGCRFTWLADKVGVLCDADSPALMQIAAEWHESHTERANSPEVLHNSFIDDEGSVFTGRWCKTVKRKVVRYARRKDKTYDDDVDAGVEAWDIKKAEEKAHELARRIFVARLLRLARSLGKVQHYRGCASINVKLENGVRVAFRQDEDEDKNFVVCFDTLCVMQSYDAFEKAMIAVSEIVVNYEDPDGDDY